MVDGDVRYKVVQAVRFHDAMHDVAADEAEIAVHGCGGTTSKIQTLLSC